ncbi:MAG: threonine/serine exporter family protein [Campylobacterales bacterium]
MIESVLHILQNSFFGAIAAMGFGVLFNVPKKALLSCGVVGAGGIFTRSVLQSFGVDIVLATFIASLSVGLLALFFYRYHYAPTAVFAVTGAIPMVPGVYAFKSMIGIISMATEPASTEILLEITTEFTKTALILIAIAAGITAPTLISKRFRMVM